MNEAKKPGYVEFKVLNNQPQLDDLWFMVGSRCNLACSHCYVASSPFNNTLQQITLEDIKPFLKEAQQFGVKNIYFTGGEPFINREIIAMIEESLKYGDVTILTNATGPLHHHLDKLRVVQDAANNTLRFRVSIDHYERDKHDAIRGNGNFDRTVANVAALHAAGFQTIVTASAVVYEDNPLSEEEIVVEFKKLFDDAIDVKLLPFTLEMGTNLERIDAPSKHVFISEDCMKRPGITPAMFQCHNGRTIEKIDGVMQVYPCPIIYNDKRFELATTLKESFNKVHLTHKACFDFCYKSGGKCTN